MLCWKATAEWNIKVKNSLENRRIKVGKNEVKKFHLFYLKKLQLAKIDHKNFTPF